MSEQNTTIEATSRDGITIGLMDAMLTIAATLNERLKRPAMRSSEAVQIALADLSHSPVILNLIRPYDEKAMEIIRKAAERMEKEAANV